LVAYSRFPDGVDTSLPGPVALSLSLRGSGEDPDGSLDTDVCGGSVVLGWRSDSGTERGLPGDWLHVMYVS